MGVKKERAAYRYVGANGDYLLGVAPRDLTEDDVAALDEATVKAIESSALYEKAKVVSDG